MYLKRAQLTYSGISRILIGNTYCFRLDCFSAPSFPSCPPPFLTHFKAIRLTKTDRVFRKSRENYYFECSPLVLEIYYLYLSAILIKERFFLYTCNHSLFSIFPITSDFLFHIGFLKRLINFVNNRRRVLLLYRRLNRSTLATVEVKAIFKKKKEREKEILISFLL